MAVCVLDPLQCKQNNNKCVDDAELERCLSL